MTRTFAKAAGAVSVVMLLAAAAPASAQFRLDRQMALAPGGTFTLETDVGAVSIVGDSAGGAAVTVTSGRDEFDEQFDIRFEEGAGSARVTVKRRGRSGWAFWRGWSDNNTRFTIHVPRETSVRIDTSGGSIEARRLEGRAGLHTSGGALHVESLEGDVNGDTSGGSIHMRDVRGDVVASTSGGSIDISDVAGALVAKTSGGGIRAHRVGGDISAGTSGGGVEIREAGGRVEAHSSGGPVTVAFAAGNGRGGDLSTSGGGIRAEIDPAVALSIDASASGGGVEADVPLAVRGRISRDALRGELNGGGALLRMSTSGGGVRISRAERSARAR